MSAIVSGIFSHPTTAPSQLKAGSANPQAAAPTSSSASDSATISANDFLTLLVTEMKNQDPTSNADPNQYINQLVSVNSLEQLISINQTLTTSAPPTKGIVRDPATSPLVSAASATQAAATAASAAALSPAAQGIARPTLAHVVEGNLAVPAANPAALRVSQALTLPSNSR